MAKFIAKLWGGKEYPILNREYENENATPNEELINIICSNVEVQKPTDIVLIYQDGKKITSKTQSLFEKSLKE